MKLLLKLIFLYILLEACNGSALPQNSENILLSPSDSLEILKIQGKVNFSFEDTTSQSNLKIVHDIVDSIINNQVENKQNKIYRIFDFASFSLDQSNLPVVDSIINLFYGYSSLLDSKAKYKFKNLKNDYFFIQEEYESIEPTINSDLDFSKQNLLLKYYYLKDLFFESVKLRYGDKTERSLVTALYALELINKKNLSNIYPSLKTRLLDHIGLLFLDYHYDKLAGDYFEKSLDIIIDDPKEVNLLAKIKTHIIYSFIYQEKFAEAERALNNLMIDKHKLNPLTKSFIHKTLGDYFYESGELIKSNEAYKTAIQSFDNKHFQTIGVINFLSNNYIELNQLDSAQHYLNLALQNIELDNSNVSNARKFTLLSTQGNINYLKFDEDGSEIYLENAERDYSKVLQLYDFEDSHNVYFHYSYIYSDIGRKLLNLYSKGNLFGIDESLIEKSLQVMDDSKNRSIAFAKNNLLNNYLTINKTNNSKIEKLNHEINSLKKETENFRNLIDISKYDFKKYYDSYRTKDELIDSQTELEKYEPTKINVPVLKEFLNEENAQYLNYYQGDAQIYCVFINPDTSHFYKIELEDVNGLNLKSEDEQLNKDSIDAQLIKLADILIRIPFSKKYKNIIISPDGFLNNIPFDALITNNTTSLDSVRYLIEDFNVSYINSVSDLLNDQSVFIVDKTDFLSYSNQNTKDISSDKYKELKYSLKEINNARSTLENVITNAISGLNLTKPNFQKALSTDILHFAGHSVSGMGSYLDNYLILRDDDGNPEPLYAYEIKYLQPKVKHAVLSSCDSGIGVYKFGEGTFSLSRAFLESGTQAVTKSLWKVNDQSTAMLMEAYYENMKTMPLSEALRQAKLTLMNDKMQPELRHPYY
ncbi:MAG: CHAT domain-containing protein, partial [Bacteroidia bacterium]|nr:CHAT domain-containing protein [Bacteroidia bacterium]